MPYSKPLPQPNPDTKPFWDGCREHQLRFQKCAACGHVRWPPAILCPMCYSPEVKWLVASGKGKVYSFVVYHQVYHEAFRNEVPYVTAVVELEEGPHLLTNITGCRPDAVRCDMPVTVDWDDISPEFSLPRFRPVQ